MQQLQNIIETAFERRAEITPANADTVTREAVNQVIALLDSGALRVAEKIDGQWVTHQWLKKAVLLSFRINDNQVIEGADEIRRLRRSTFPERRLPRCATSGGTSGCVYCP